MYLLKAVRNSGVAAHRRASSYPIHPNQPTPAEGPANQPNEAACRPADAGPITVSHGGILARLLVEPTDRFFVLILLRFIAGTWIVLNAEVYGIYAMR